LNTTAKNYNYKPGIRIQGISTVLLIRKHIINTNIE